MVEEGKDIFVEKIIKGELSPPTRREFRLEKWHKAWEKVKESASTRDNKVYMAGLIVDSLLSEIRAKLIELYKNAPKTNFEKLMLAYVAISNRDVAVALKIAIQEPRPNAHGIMIKSGGSGGALSLQEVAHGAVDGLQVAIRQCQRNIDKNNTLTISDSGLDILDFIQYESRLSNLYSSYEHLWQCIIWSDYELEEIEKESKCFRVKQPSNDFEVSFEASAIRKSRLSAQKSLIANSKALQRNFKTDKLLKIRRQNKSRVAYVAYVFDSGDKLIAKNTQWRLQVMELQRHFPKQWLEKKHRDGFSIYELLDVVRCLMLLANSQMDKFPDNDAVLSLHRLMEFCPRVKSQSLRLALRDITNIDSVQVSKILDFLTATSEQSSDLWCEPLIKTSGNEYAILVSALSSPSIERLVEHWFPSFDINLEDKGYAFEKTVVDMLNAKLEKNQLIEDFDKAVGKRIKLDTGEEEFDLLVRIDDLVLIGESKSIVTTDSPISQYRTAQILSHASRQVIRKTDFLKHNIGKIFSSLGWDYDSAKKYNIAQCIINSSKIFVGYNFSGIPVVDEDILSNYFASSVVRIMSIPKANGDIKDIAWYELYNNIQELKSNLQTYLCYPPQLNENSGSSFEYGDIKLPCINEDSFKIMKKRLVVRNKGPLAILDREHKFRLVKSDDYDSEVALVTATV